MARIVKDTEAAAESLALQLQLVPARDPDALNDAFSEIAAHGAGAFIVLPSPMLFSQHSQIVEALAELGQLGFMGMLVPEAYGGAGADHVDYALALEEIAAGDGATSTILSVNSLCCG